MYRSVVSNKLFSKTAHKIFLKFYVKLEGTKCQKLTYPNFSEKILILRKKPKNSSKIGVFLTFA